ncbi:MAG: NAD(P)H-dependent glycerol-3-phosphate dehydrogenase [Acidimicrobiia bacterium]
MEKIAVIGAGSWGTTAAWLAAANVPVLLWARRDDVVAEINSARVNSQYLPGLELQPTLTATGDLAEAVEGAELVALAVPSHGFRSVFEQIAPLIPNQVPVISLTKGIEQGSLLRMTEIVSELLPDHDTRRVGVLTGPNLASEIAAEQPTAAVIAVADPETGERIQGVFMAPLFRVYTNDDVIGSELGGALKNVMAIAAGMSDGLGFGDNTRATLITRALAELTRLGTRLGGRPGTFAGLAGMGDLIATCVSSRSRNHRVGFGMAQGRSLDEVIDDMNMVAEGVKTTRAVLDLANKFDVEMPIASHVGTVLYEGMSPKEAMLSLMTREAKPE